MSTLGVRAPLPAPLPARRRASMPTRQRAALPALRRWLRFNAVGLAGIVVQAGTLAVLLAVLGRRQYLPATALAVEAAVLHNFAWHVRWTWADRPASTAAAVLKRLLKFNVTTGACSIAGNLAAMRLLVGEMGLHPMLANLLGIGAMALVNYFVSDRFVFTARPRGRAEHGGAVVGRAAAHGNPETHSKRSSRRPSTLNFKL